MDPCLRRAPAIETTFPRPRLAWTAAALWVAAGVLGCPQPTDTHFGAGDGDDDDSAAVDPPDPIQGGAVVIKNPNNRFSALVTVAFDRDVDVQVEYWSDEAEPRRTPVQTVPAEVETELLVLGLYARSTYSFRVLATDGAVDWTSPTVPLETASLNEQWLPCSVIAPERGPFDGDEVICTDIRFLNDVSVYYCVDRGGRPVWELKHPDGERMRHVRALRGGGFAASGHTRSFIALFDQAGRLLTEFKDIWFDGKTVYHHEWINQHEVIEITEGPWDGALAILTNTTDEVDGGNTTGAGVIIFDPVTKEILWDWSAHGELGDDWPADPLLPYDRFGQMEPNATEWLHANALLHGVDDDGRQYVWLSLRAQDWIIKIDIETSAVVWRLGNEGDFEFVDDLDGTDPAPLDLDLWMYQQHGPEFQAREGARTRFLVFDNGNVRPHPTEKGLHFSRVAEFEIDEETMRATLRWAYGSDDPESPEFFASHAYGDADMLPGGDSLMFVAGFLRPLHSFIAEVSYPGGEELWRYDCPEGPGMYRVNYYPSLYDTTWWYDVER